MYHIPLKKLDLLKNTLHKHLNSGFIIPSKVTYTSPILFKLKLNKEWRFCIDYRKLNRITKKDKYPSPLINKTFHRITRAKVFIKLNIRYAFHRIRIHLDSKVLTAFNTYYKAYQYKIIPFGLYNGPATFQRFINSALKGLLNIIYTAYVNNILIYSKNPQQHKEYVKKVLAWLRTTGL